MRLALLVALVLVGRAEAQPEFAGTFAVPGVLCDCDPADFVFRTTRRIPGHATPDPSSEMIRRVEAGRLIEGNDWSEALTVVTLAGRATARVDTTLIGLNDYGAARFVAWSEDELPTVELQVRSGDEIELLLADQGYVFFRHEGRLYGGFDPTADGVFEMETGPQEAVWFHLVPREDRPAAWVEIRMPRGDRAGNVEIVCETHTGCAPE
jgi:hypothetical protein